MATAILTLIAGVGVFLVACTMLSSNLESICSSKLRHLFARASDKKLVGVGIGTVSTAAIQSSGATTVLVIGFVNAGIMSLTLAATVIYGANIGTTITAQIVAWGMMGGGISFATIFAALAGIGAFIAAYAKSDKNRKIGGIIAGFGLLFVGLDLMSGAMKDFASDDGVKDFLSNINNVLLLVILGAAITAAVQSSSVMTTVIIAMLVAGLIDLEQGIYLTLGSNIGSCVVAIMAGFTGSLNAKRTALIHLLFNCIGVAIFMVFGYFYGITTGDNLGILFGNMFDNNPGIQLAMFHTIFNVITVIIMLPLTELLIKTVMKIIPDRKEQQTGGMKLTYVDDNMLRTPAIAITEVRNEVVHMAELSILNFKRACDMVRTLDMSEKENFAETEKMLDFTNVSLSHFLVKLSNKPLNTKDLNYVTSTFHSIMDIERVGDYAENIVEYADKLISLNKEFSQYAKDDVVKIEAIVENLYEKVIATYKSKSEDTLEEAYAIEQQVDDVTAEMADDHIKRLGDGICEAAVGAEFLSFTSDVERIADHYMNVGKSIREFK